MQIDKYPLEEFPATDDFPIGDLTLDPWVQGRLALNQEAVEDYAEAMLGGASFPPCRAFFDGETTWLSRGFHRITAALRIGLKVFAVQVLPGTKWDAMLDSMADNWQNGIYLTRADKRANFLKLMTDPDWACRSSRAIAERVGVSYQTITRWRDELEDQAETVVVHRGDQVYEMTPGRPNGKGQPQRKDDQSLDALDEPVRLEVEQMLRDGDATSVADALEKCDVHTLETRLLDHALKTIEACPCRDGCPSCVGPPSESGRRAKEAARDMLRLILR